MKRAAALTMFFVATFAAGLLLPRGRVEVKTGFVETGLVRPWAASAGNADSFSITNDFRAALAGGGGDASFSDSLVETERANLALAGRKAALLSETIRDRNAAAIKLETDSMKSELAGWLDERKAAADVELDALAEKIAAEGGPDYEEHARRLLNANLQLKTLTRDTLSLSESKRVDLEKRIEKLLAEIAEIRDAAERKQMEDYEAGGKTLEESLENEYNRKRSGAELALRTALDEIEGAARGELERIRETTERQASDGNALRRRMADWNAPAAGRGARRGAGKSGGGADALFMAELSASAAEVCADRGVALLFADPLWASKKVVNYTKAVSAKGAFGGKRRDKKQ